MDNHINIVSASESARSMRLTSDERDNNRALCDYYIIKDAEGKQIVIINDLRFKGRKSVNWDVVEKCLKEYIGKYAESSIIKELLEIATNKTFSENYEKKHAFNAKYGWYRYDTRFALPVYNDHDELEKYNVFSARVLVRHDQDGKLYLYDIVRTKKETSRPHEQ